MKCPLCQLGLILTEVYNQSLKLRFNPRVLETLALLTKDSARILAQMSQLGFPCKWSIRPVPLCSCVCVCVLSCSVTFNCLKFSWQEYWSGLPFPSPGDLLDSGIEPRSPTLQADTLPSELPGKILVWLILIETQAGIKIFQGEISITSDMQMKPPLWQKAKN